MNWLAYVIKALTLVPAAVAGVEGIVTGAKQGATKKQLATAALQVATGVAENVLPQDQAQLAGAASTLVSNSIDMWTGFFNQSGVFQHSTPVATPTATSVAAGN